jgi:hypothetical protein
MGAPTAMDGRLDGKFFEQCFERFARYSGLFPKKTELSARWIGPRKVQAIKSDLDFRLVNREGRVGYFDCKSFHGSKFRYSAIDRDQLRRALDLNDWNVPAGFVVFFREVNRVSFFSALSIALAGPGSSFSPEDGVSLGSLETLDLKPLLPLSGASEK